MDSDNPDLPDKESKTFVKRNARYIGALVIIILAISAFYAMVYRDSNTIDPEFARQNALIPEQSLQHWYVAYLSETRLFYHEVDYKLSDTEYVLKENDANIEKIIFYQDLDEGDESSFTNWYAEFESTDVQYMDEAVSIYFDIKGYIPTDPFVALNETVDYPYLEKITLLFDAWDEDGIENQQLAYGMSEISEAVGRLVGDTDLIDIREITDQDYIDIYKKDLGVPTKPVIYLFTEPNGALKNNVVIPFDGMIVLEMPHYEQIRMFSVLVGQIISPTVQAS